MEGKQNSTSSGSSPHGAGFGAHVRELLAAKSDCVAQNARCGNKVYSEGHLVCFCVLMLHDDGCFATLAETGDSRKPLFSFPHEDKRKWSFALTSMASIS